MEVLSGAHNSNSGANPSSVKSEDGSPPPDGDRGSPPPNCAICLGRCKNKSFTDSCLHQFCFKCLVTWSRVKTECPLCKQNFKSIIHNVQSNQQYEEYRVEQRRQEEERIDIDDLVTATRRFRYRTTLTIPRGAEHTHIALQRLLMNYPPLSAMVGMSRELPVITPAALPSSRRRRSPSSFRRTVYRHNLWARPLADFTGRHRDCTPEFYRYNSSQMYRLVPWLNRELHYLLLENSGHIAYVLSRILDLLPQYHITSPEFRENVYRYFGTRTDHFLHELHCFASTPYDLTGYDRNVQYTTDSRISNTVNDISSSDTDSGDSDIVLVTEPQRGPFGQLFGRVTREPIEPYPGPSPRHVPEPVYPLHRITSPIEQLRQAQSVIPIETIDHSDTDDDEVMVTGYIKPPNQRTPEVVDLRDSDDSDVVVTEGPPEPRGLVKLTLSRPKPDSDSEGADATYTPPHAPPSRSSDSTTPSSPSPSPCPTPSPVSSPRADHFNEAELRRLSSLSISPKSSENRNDASNGRGNRRRRTRRSREADREREAAATSTPAPASAPAPAPAPAPHSSPPRQASPSNDRSTPDRDRREKEKRKKSKSHNGKGVKSSRRNNATEMRTESASVEEEPRPGPSATARSSKAAKTSRRDDRTTNSKTEDGAVPVEPRPGQPRSGKVGKSSRWYDCPESRKVESAMEEREEPQPGPSSRSGGKGGKSHRDETTELQRAEPIAEPKPGPSSRAGPSGSLKRKNNEEIPDRRNSRESKRLKSVVKKASNWNSAGLSSSSAVRPSSSVVRPSSSTVPTAGSAVFSKTHGKRNSTDDEITDAPPSPGFFTDSDDDIPLNLTIRRSCGLP